MFGFHIDAPLLDGTRTCRYEGDRTIKACSGIPAAALTDIVEADSKRVGTTILIYIRCGIDVEGRVAVLPFASLLAVDIDLGFGHGAVEVEDGTLCTSRHRELRSVPPYPNPGKRTGAAGLFGGLGFAVLHDGHVLAVEVHVEGTADGPVVRNGNLLPMAVVEVYGSVFGCIVV